MSVIRLNGVNVHKILDEQQKTLVQTPTAPTQPYNPYGIDAIFMNGGGIFVQGNGVLVRTDGFYQGGMPSNPRIIPLQFETPNSKPKTLKEFRGIVSARVIPPSRALLTVEDIFAAKEKENFQNEDVSLSVVSIGSGMANLVLEMPRELYDSQLANNIQMRKGRNFIRQEATAFDQIPGVQLEFIGPDNKPISVVVTRGAVDMTQQTTVKQAFSLLVPSAKEKYRLVVNGRRPVDLAIPFALKEVPVR
jgi:hypothetical protein